MEISSIPTHELLKDLADARFEIRVCEIFLEHDMHHIFGSGTLTTDVMSTDKEIVKVILEELSRRSVNIT